MRQKACSGFNKLARIRSTRVIGTLDPPFPPFVVLRHPWILRDLIRSLPVRSASRPSRSCCGFPGHPIRDYAEFTLSERSESNGLRPE